jgi:hypothetical protein
MSASAPVFDRIFLDRAEHTYRQQLVAHPEDTDLRLRLAWCLFMQALYQAGQEAAISAGASDPGQSSECLSERDSQNLLKDCLQQTYTVMHVGAQSGERPDVEKIQELVRLSGTSEVLLQAQDRATFILTKLAGEILNAAEPVRQPSKVARSRRTRLAPRSRRPLTGD